MTPPDESPSRVARDAVPQAAATELGYLLYLPAGHAPRDDRAHADDERSSGRYGPTSGPALVVSLHGSGERGNDLDLLEVHGLPRRLATGLHLPAVVLAPQCPRDQVWGDHLPFLHDLTLHVVRKHGVDPTRIAVTGLSLGGLGAYQLASAYPETYTRVAPVCAPRAWRSVTRASAALPTWVFHGDADEVVPVGDSRRLVAAIERLGGCPRLTVYPGVGHDSWVPAYEDEELLTWLLAGTSAARSSAIPS